MTVLLNHPKVKPLLSDEHFSVDGTLIDAWASHKSFKPKDGSGGDASQGYGKSQTRRKLIECVFGWGKQHGTLRKTKHRSNLARKRTKPRSKIFQPEIKSTTQIRKYRITTSGNPFSANC